MSGRVLVTGTNGQLGWELTRRATAAGHKVYAFDQAGLDITNPTAVRSTIEKQSPSIVVNAAAYTAVDKAESESDLAFAVNRDGPAHLSSACAERDIPLIHISTDYVFDGSKTAPYVEDDPTAPLGVYGASKLAGEEAIRASGARHIILRTSWVYGVHGANFVKTMLRLAESQNHLRVVNDQVGGPTFAGDLAEAIFKIVDQLSDDNTSYGTFHCAGRGETSWCDFARAIFELAGPKLPSTPTVEGIATSEYPTAAQRPANSRLECSKLTQSYGITLRPWQDALADMLGRVMIEHTATAKDSS